MSALQAQQCCVWDNYKFALYSKLREAKLYRFAAQGEWDLIPKRCKSHPKEASFVHKYEPKDTPLNRLLRTQNFFSCSQEMKQNIFEMKYRAVAALLEAHSPATTMLDSFRRTPLHWACMDVVGNHVDDETPEESILLLLVQKGPQAARMVDMEDRTPLHYLVARNDAIPVKLLAKMVAFCPEALNMKDEVGETPLDIIQSRREELNNADELAETLSKLQSLLTSSVTDAESEVEQ